MSPNKYFIKIKDVRIRTSTINSYSLAEYHTSVESGKYRIKIVTSRTSYIIPVKDRAEGDAILKGVDEFLVFNNENE